MLKDQDQAIRIEYTGKLAGDEIKFARKVGDIATTEIVAKRVKEPAMGGTMMMDRRDARILRSRNLSGVGFCSGHNFNIRRRLPGVFVPVNRQHPWEQLNFIVEELESPSPAAE